MAKMKYRISARATILLGREGVSKADGAVVELIKNTYDADAEVCVLCIDKANDTIYLFDNGTGMDITTIRDCWMLIGTANKRENYQSDKNRIKSGEKGIGRFALDRLGSSCTMYTKMKNANHTLRWQTDWSEFENANKTLDQIEADIEEREGCLDYYLPIEVVENINAFVKKINEKREEKRKISVYENGTVFIIKNLRDQWSDNAIRKLNSNLGILLPPKEQVDFFLGTMDSLDSSYREVANDISEDYDYNLKATFNGKKFRVAITRNEYDLHKIPEAVFEREEFLEYPYRKVDFEKREIIRDITIEELLKSNDTDLIRKTQEIGHFTFNYNFMKLSLRDDSKETFFYKEISSKRAEWLKEFGGVKIYRDDFFVRPYGDPETDSFDWLGLDARYARNPAGIANENGSWNVRNKQSQGTIAISRVYNRVLLDRSSREGIIENDYFTLFKNVILALIAVFERDRAYIGRAMRRYSDEVNKKERAKEEGKRTAEKVMRAKKPKASNQETEEDSDAEKLAKALEIYEEEREELLTEVQQLRSLATNGLITSTIAHDLKGINAILITRVDTLRKEIEKKREDGIERNLRDLALNDQFLKSWLTIVANQARKDKRTRKKYNMYDMFTDIINVLEPILKRKHVNILLSATDKSIERRAFQSNFESILYNLIINSIEAFEKSKRQERNIWVTLENDEETITIRYKDNGPGFADFFENPYDIFNYGTTSKVDKDGNLIGTGMGMYIVASTLREYDSTPTILEYKDGFEFKMQIKR